MDATAGAHVDPLVPALTKYACTIVQEFFGGVPQTVFKCLIDIGPCTLRDVRNATNLGRADAANALIVLIQHSFAQPFLREDVVSARHLATRTVYQVDTRRVLMFMRQPAFLLHVADTVNEDADRVCKQLAQHGRLPFHGIVQRAAAELEGVAEEQVAQNCARALVHLFRERLVEQVPPCDMPLMNKPDERKASGRGRKKASEEQKKLEASKALTLDLYLKIRYQLPPDVVALCAASAGADAADILQSSLGGTSKAAGAKEGGGRKGSSAKGDPSPILLRLNFDGFMVHFLQVSCVDHVAASFGPEGREVMRGFLDVLRPSQLNAIGRGPVLTPVPPSAVQEQLKRNLDAEKAEKGGEEEEGGAPEVDADQVDVDGMLQGLAMAGNMHETGQGGFVFEHELMVAQMQRQELGGYLKSRFGVQGHRVWRLLQEHKYMEVDQIERLALLNTRDARTALYGLFKYGYIKVQEVPRSVERAPSRTTYLFHVDFHRSLEQLTADICKAAGNLMVRAAHHEECEKGLLEIVQRAKRGEDVKMSENQLRSAARLRKIIRTLNASVLELDRQLQIFSYQKL